MNISIRKFLLIYLLLAIAVTTSLAIIANYYLDQEDIEFHLDSILSQSALAFQAMLGDDIHTRDLAQLQKTLAQITPKAQKFFEDQLQEDPDDDYEDKFQYQVWKDDGTLLLHSLNAPREPLSAGDEGFSVNTLNDHHWRVFTSYNKKAGLSVVVAERFDIRNELFYKITENDFYIMLLTFPLSGFLIWLIIGRGLKTLDRVAKEVSHRAATYLEPVDVKWVPLEIKPVISELNQLFFRLHQAFEREKRFAADAAHELKTPLAALRTQSQVAISTQNSEERNSSLENIIASVDRSTHIVQQLLTLSRLVPEAITNDDFNEINLYKLAAEIIAQLVPEAINKNIEIELVVEDESIFVPGIPTALGVLIRNLVDNAIRYTPRGGSVTVSITQHNSSVLLRVQDNGPGIPPELRARVFERFFRTLGTKTSGSGLGLAIVAQIASLHNAEVTLGQPEQGTGLVIEVLFPTVCAI